MVAGERRLTFNKVLGHLVDYWEFIWDDGSYRIVDSKNTPNVPGAWVVLASDSLRIRILNDRDLLFLDFQEASGGSGWYSVDLIQGLMGTEPTGTELTDYDVEFVKRNLTEIEAAFSERLLAESKRRLNELKQERSKRLFG